MRTFEWYLALRYFRGKRKGSRFLSFIKIMSITGVAVGSAGLLIALTIVHGFKATITDKIFGFAPHVTVSTYGPDPLYRADTLITTLEKYPEVNRVQPVVVGQAMVQAGDHISGVYLKGVDEQGDITELYRYMNQGGMKLGTDSAGRAGIVIGAGLARTLDVQVGDRIIAYTLQGLPSPLNTPELQQFNVSGIYETGINRFDESYALVQRKYARKLFRMQGVQASSVEMQLKDPDQIKSFDDKLYQALSFPYITESIYQQYGNLFAWVDLQEQTIPFVIAVMIIVAAFNLIGSVLMMVLERTRDIGILKTMGARMKSVRRIFLLEGILVAIVGLLIGLGIAVLFYFLQSHYHLIPLSQENYYMSYAPVEMHGIDFLIVSAVTLVLCSLASWLPARVAAKTDPLKVIAFGR